MTWSWLLTYIQCIFTMFMFDLVITDDNMKYIDYENVLQNEGHQNITFCVPLCRFGLALSV